MAIRLANLPLDIGFDILKSYRCSYEGDTALAVSRRKNDRILERMLPECFPISVTHRLVLNTVSGCYAR